MAKGKKRGGEDLPLFDLPLRDTDEIETATALELDPPESGFEDAALDDRPGGAALDDRGTHDRDADLTFGDPSDDGDFRDGDPRDSPEESSVSVYEDDGVYDEEDDGNVAYDDEEVYEEAVDDDYGSEVTEVVADPTAPAQRGLFEHLEEDHGELDDELDLGEMVASPVDRLLAGVADLGVHGALLALTAGACIAVGVPVTFEDWPPFAGLALVLSFLYWIIPLAFWGQTPGMAWIGTVARSEDDEPLSFGQAVLRWVGALSTTALGGLPLLMALGEGRSLSDRMSDSKTLAL